MALDLILAQQFAAIPVHSPRQYSRLGLDVRLAKKFIRSRSIPPEERQMLVRYIVRAKWVPDERAVYGAVVDGFSTVEEISTVTGLSAPRVETTVGKLERKGMLRKVKA